MDTLQALHPTDATLHAYGLGRLDDDSAEFVGKHLKSCPSCLRRAGEISSDSFLDKLRAVQGLGPPVMSTTGQPQAEPSRADRGSAILPAIPAGTLPPGLAGHPDYLIVGDLGEGGMGVVYLARNRLMDRHEVLKVVSSQLMNRRGVSDRFLGEVRNAARLQHPNIVTAYSAFRAGASIVFAMEYVDGYDLAKQVRAQGPLQVPLACYYAYQAAVGLQYAHEQGMVHRDIKPSNLIVARRGKRAVVKILDFGLAKATREGPVDGGLTHEGQMLGTPDYIAPEQISNARDADIRADIYSLGCTLYFLLTGNPPFQATNLYEILQAHHSMDALPLNLARPEVPVELAAVVAKMMAKEPERRFQEPIDVARALKPFFMPAEMTAVPPRAELSRPGLSVVGQASSEAAPVPARSATHLSLAMTPTAGQPEASTQPGSILHGLIELGEIEPIAKAAPMGARANRRKPWVSWQTAAAVLILVIASGGLIYQLASEIERLNSDPLRRGKPGNSREIAMPRWSHSRKRASGTEQPGSALAASRKADPHPNEAKPPWDEPPPTDGNEDEKKVPENSSDDGGSNAGMIDPAPLETPVRPDADDTPERRLTNLGLRRSDKFYVLEQESEVEQKFKSSLSLENQYVQLLKEKEEIEAGVARIKELDQNIARLDFEISARNQELRGRPGRPNSVQKDYYDTIEGERNEFDRLKNLALFEVRTLRNQIPNPNQRHELDLKIQRVYDSRRSEFRELREMIRWTSSSYEDLSRNQQVQNDLAELGRKKGTELKLGPSPDYQLIVTRADAAAKIIEAPAARTPKAATTPEKKKSNRLR